MIKIDARGDAYPLPLMVKGQTKKAITERTAPAVGSAGGQWIVVRT